MLTDGYTSMERSQKIEEESPVACSEKSTSTDAVVEDSSKVYTGMSSRRMKEIQTLTEETVESFGVHGAEKFVLRELLGEGGFGSVYRCTLQSQEEQCSTFVLHIEKDRPGLLSECAEILKHQGLDVRDAQVNAEGNCERATHTYSVVENFTGRNLPFERLIEVQDALSKLEFVRCMIKHGDVELDRENAASYHALRASSDTFNGKFVVAVRNDDSSDGKFTSVTVEGPNINGLVAAITAALNAASLNIQKFHGGCVDDSPGKVQDVFHVTRDGKQMPTHELEALENRLRVATSTLDPDNAPNSGQDFAVKVVNARRLALISGCPLEAVCPIVRREVEVLNHLGSHPRLVKLHYAYYSNENSRFYLVSELVRGGDLFSAIVRRGKPFNESEARTLLAQLTEAIAFCHSRQVAHRDLKLENCLLEAPDSLSVKVCDYGQSKFFGFGDQANSKTLTTSPAYTAPEVMQAVQDAKPYDAYKADVFSLGVVLYCLICNALPFDAGKRRYEHHRAWPSLSQAVRNLIGTLLAANADLRPQAEEVLQDDWIVSVGGLHSSPSSCPSSSSFAALHPVTGHALDREHGKSAREALVSVHTVIDALQKERVSCVSTTVDDHWRFFWQSRHSDEKLVLADQSVCATSEKFESEDSKIWLSLQNALRHSASDVVRLRTMHGNILHSGALSQEQVDAQLMSVFMEYHLLLSRLISAMLHVFPLLRSFCSVSVVDEPLRIEMRLRLLALANEQLARERGFLAAHVRDPQQLRKIPAVLSLAEVIGARKLLVGAAEGGEDTIKRYEPHLVASADGGLSCALQLAEASPLEIRELLALDRFEKRFLCGSDDNADQQSAFSDWWHLLLELQDKLHYLMVSGFMELFAHEGSNRVGCLK